MNVGLPSTMFPFLSVLTPGAIGGVEGSSIQLSDMFSDSLNSLQVGACSAGLGPCIALQAFSQSVMIKAELPLQESAVELQRLLDKHSLPDVPDYCKQPASVSNARAILTYAHKLCYTAFAPPGYEAGITQLHHFRPPMPQEWQLRASILHQHAGMLLHENAPNM